MRADAASPRSKMSEAASMSNFSLIDDPDPRMSHSVVVVRGAPHAGYPTINLDKTPTETRNQVIRVTSTPTDPIGILVQRLFAEAGFDAEHLGHETWSPLSALIRPGNRILIKPNLVSDRNQAASGMDCLVTHSQVLRAVLEYALLAQPGQVVIGDAPIQGCDFEQLMHTTGYAALRSDYDRRALPVKWADFRRTILVNTSTGRQRLTERRGLDEYILFDLGTNSLLEPISGDAERFRVTMYDPKMMRQTHCPGVHQYLIAREAIEADVVINLPKLKTHKKAGITGALKNLVGINGHKDYLPHHRKGGSTSGGDCYVGGSQFKGWAEDLLDAANRREGRASHLFWRGAQACLALARMAGADSNIEGSWYGNDTVWRMCLDLNRILMYGRPDGTLASAPQRHMLHITDAIIAGEGEGPLAPHPRPIGILTCSLNPVAADYAHAWIMGLDWNKIPIVREGFTAFPFPITRFSPEDVVLQMDRLSHQQPWKNWGIPAFTPPQGWRGHCELAD